MATAELDVTLASLSLTAEMLQSGNVLHITLDDVSLISTCSITAYGMASCSLENLSLSSEASVYITGELDATLGGLTAKTFGEVYTGIDSPYEDVLSWTGHPLTGSRVRVRLGNLHGIFGENDEFGLYAGDGWDAKSGSPPAASSQYIRIGSHANEFHNIPIKLYDSGNVTMQMEPTAPSFSMGDPLPTGYDTGTGLWQGKDTDDVYKWRVGDPSIGGSMLSWSGSSLSIVNGSLDIRGASAHIALGDPPPKSPTSGTGIWIDKNGLYGINDGVLQIFLDTLDGRLYIDGGTEFGVSPLLGNLYIEGVLTLGTDGKLLQGTGTWGVDFTGSAIWAEGSPAVMMMGGLNNNIKQWYGGSDGKLYAGAGDVVLDQDGITINIPQYTGDDRNKIKFDHLGTTKYTISSDSAGRYVNHYFQHNDIMEWHDTMYQTGTSNLFYERELIGADNLGNQRRAGLRLNTYDDPYDIFQQYVKLFQTGVRYLDAEIKGTLDKIDSNSSLLLHVEATNEQLEISKTASILLEGDYYTYNKDPYSKIDLTADSINIIGNADISGNLVVDGTIKDGSNIAYLKSTEKAADSNKLDGKTLAQVMLSIYPVGAIYMSSASTNPGTLFGGTWEAYGQGRVLVGKASSGTFANAGATGGSETHTLTVAQMPSHTHTQNAHSHTIPSDASGADYATTRPGGTGNTLTTSSTTATNQNTGGGEAHNNLQPYIVVYMWRRTG